MSSPINTLPPEITLDVAGRILRNGRVCRVELSATRITIGCSNITPEAAQKIMSEWDKRFGRGPTVCLLQEEETFAYNAINPLNPHKSQ